LRSQVAVQSQLIASRAGIIRVILPK
jgi:hypothetical protein